MELTLEGLRIDCCYPNIQAVICGLQFHRRFGRHKHYTCKAEDVLACRKDPDVDLKELHMHDWYMWRAQTLVMQTGSRCG